ncbi:MAG: hypothetical protein FJY11_03485 [Bacteroidetes bacterium]|nr:hypothetical protein [Bacteroidota bacterium]
MKKLLLITAVAMILSSCGQKTTKQAGVEATDAIPVTAIGDLVTNPLEFGDKVVKVEGVIDHMCRHSGSKMMVKGSDSDLSVHVQLGDLASEFSVELEGRTVVLEGLFQFEVTNKAELGEDAPEKAEGEEHDCAAEKAVAEALKAKGIDPAISPFIKLAKYEIK